MGSDYPAPGVRGPRLPGPEHSPVGARADGDKGQIRSHGKAAGDSAGPTNSGAAFCPRCRPAKPKGPRCRPWQPAEPQARAHSLSSSSRPPHPCFSQPRCSSAEGAPSRQRWERGAELAQLGRGSAPRPVRDCAGTGPEGRRRRGFRGRRSRFLRPRPPGALQHPTV